MNWDRSIMQRRRSPLLSFFFFFLPLAASSTCPRTACNGYGHEYLASSPCPISPRRKSGDETSDEDGLHASCSPSLYRSFHIPMYPIFPPSCTRERPSGSPDARSPPAVYACIEEQCLRALLEDRRARTHARRPRRLETSCRCGWRRSQAEGAVSFRRNSCDCWAGCWLWFLSG